MSAFARCCAVLILVSFTFPAAGAEPAGQARKENIYGVTESGKLIRFNAGQPQRIQSSKALGGLAAGEKILGMDYRESRGVLFALGSSGRLYTIDVATAKATQVGGVLGVPLDGKEFGFDISPAVDRIRVVSDHGQNFRLHPETGAVIDSNADLPGVQIDAPLAYAHGDVNAGKTPRVVSAAYSYNEKDEKITTNFAIDAEQRVLVTQGTREGVSPAVSSDTGQLFTVGALGIGGFDRVAFDISDDNVGYAAVTTGASSKLYSINLDTGRALLVGGFEAGEIVRGIAIEPD